MSDGRTLEYNAAFHILMMHTTVMWYNICNYATTRGLHCSTFYYSPMRPDYGLARFRNQLHCHWIWLASVPLNDRRMLYLLLHGLRRDPGQKRKGSYPCGSWIRVGSNLNRYDLMSDYWVKLLCCRSEFCCTIDLLSYPKDIDFLLNASQNKSRRYFCSVIWVKP